jgi:hypothetical protein
MPKKKANAKVTEKKDKKPVARPYPRVTLENALRVSIAIKDKNAGNPWFANEIAKAIGVGAKTGPFYYITAGSRDYHLTEGTSKTEKITLTALGKRVIYPNSPEEAIIAKREAFLSVDSFRKVLEYYKGSALPEKEYLANTLQTEFGLVPEVHDEFVDIFQKNCNYLGIGPKFNETIILPGDQTAVTTREQAVTYVAPGSDAQGPVCFVIMPFTERDQTHSGGFFQEVLKSLIIPAPKEAGFIVRTANRQGSDVIQSTIVNELLKAELVLADLTEHNPNVLFELGMRMREDKPVALIKATETGRIFDVDNMLRVIEYNSCLWPSTLMKDVPTLTEHLKATWDNRATDISYMKLLRQSPLATLDTERQF